MGCGSMFKTWPGSRALWISIARNWRGSAPARSRARLLEAGLRVEGDGEFVVTQVLKAAKPSDCIIVVSRPGWHRLPDPVFVTPAGETIGVPKGVRIELAASVKIADRVSRSGTIEGWQAAVWAAVSAENCPHWTLSAAA